VKRRRGSERGIALVASMFVMVVLAALVAGVAYAALQEYRMGRNSTCQTRAFYAAEAGLAVALYELDRTRLTSLAVGDSLVFSGSLADERNGIYAGAVLRLNQELLLARSIGHDGLSAAEQRLAVVARLAPVGVNVTAALASAGPVELGPSGLVDGTGAVPDGWSCPGSEAPAPGILIGDTGLLRTAGCGTSDCVRGDPPVRQDPRLRGSGVPAVEEAGWSALLDLADTVPPGTWTPDGGAGAFPILYAPGDLIVNGATAQGVLLVQGDLALEGSATFVGVVIVRGHLSIRGAGARVLGQVLASDADLGTAGGGGVAAVLYSGCAVRRALAATARPYPLAERSWAALF
jgi:hypothetical protein